MHAVEIPRQTIRRNLFVTLHYGLPGLQKSLWLRELHAFFRAHVQSREPTTQLHKSCTQIAALCSGPAALGCANSRVLGLRQLLPTLFLNQSKNLQQRCELRFLTVFLLDERSIAFDGSIRSLAEWHKKRSTYWSSFLTMGKERSSPSSF